MKKPRIEVVQIINGIYDLFGSLSFQREISSARKKLGIPVKGFPYKDNDIGRFIYSNYEPLSWEPVPSKEWSYLEVEGIVKTLIEPLGHNSNKTRHVARIYLFHNTIEENILYEQAENENMATLADNIKELEEYGHSPTVFMGFSEEKYAVYPLSIRLSPYASKEQLLSFVEKNWTDVEKIQEEYQTSKLKLGKTRKRGNPNNEIKLYIAENFKEDNNRLALDIEEKFLVERTVDQIRSIKSNLQN